MIHTKFSMSHRHNFWHDSSFHTYALSLHLLPTYNLGSPTTGATILDLVSSTDDVPGSEIPTSAKAMSMLANKAISWCSRTAARRRRWVRQLGLVT